MMDTSEKAASAVSAEYEDDKIAVGCEKINVELRNHQQRYRDFLEVQHLVKMVTIEPVIEFDEDGIISKIHALDPCMVWLGYDLRKSRLPEPPLEKVRNLYWELGTRGFTVVLKTIRKAWWEELNPSHRPQGICGRISVSDIGSRSSKPGNQQSNNIIEA